MGGQFRWGFIVVLGLDDVVTNVHLHGKVTKFNLRL